MDLPAGRRNTPEKSRLLTGAPFIQDGLFVRPTSKPKVVSSSHITDCFSIYEKKIVCFVEVQSSWPLQEKAGMKKVDKTSNRLATGSLTSASPGNMPA
ncbi:uncharacterized protein LOC144180623 isoform X2 [Haemaphysalis longicornis]